MSYISIVFLPYLLTGESYMHNVRFIYLFIAISSHIHTELESAIV